MGPLRRKEEKTETISVRVPASVKAELDELRKQADAAGFDLTATLQRCWCEWRNRCARNCKASSAKRME